MTEVNGGYWKNSAGNWQKISAPKGGNRVFPEWSMRNFTTDKMKEPDPVVCKECNKLKIPYAYHPRKKTVKFCSFRCGKTYMRRDPDFRFVMENAISEIR